ncbi:MAG: hypothetical protein J5548_09415 [Prevotella sp.]|nr:hypothetical protein [Prevotella sp.]
MKKAFIILAILFLAAGGAGYYYYDKEQKRIAEERAVRDSIRHARDVENARLAAIEKAHRDSIAVFEKTHSKAAITAAAEELIKQEFLSGRNHVGGKNWTERMNILREQCENVVAYSEQGADSVLRSFNFNGLMGKGVRMESDSITQVYYISADSAWVDVHFNIDEYEEGQDVTLKLHFIDNRWLIDDFVFRYSDGEWVSEAGEMRWFIDYYGFDNDDGEQQPPVNTEKKATLLNTDKKPSAANPDKKPNSDKKPSPANPDKKPNSDKKPSPANPDKKPNSDKKPSSSSQDKKPNSDKKPSSSSPDKKPNSDKKPNPEKKK